MFSFLILWWTQVNYDFCNFFTTVSCFSIFLSRCQIHIFVRPCRWLTHSQWSARKKTNYSKLGVWLTLGLWLVNTYFCGGEGAYRNTSPVDVMDWQEEWKWWIDHISLIKWKLSFFHPWCCQKLTRQKSFPNCENVSQSIWKSEAFLRHDVHSEFNHLMVLSDHQISVKYSK